MVTLLSPPPVTPFPPIRQRWLRGSSGSLLVHILLILLLPAGILVGTVATGSRVTAPRIVMVQAPPSVDAPAKPGRLEPKAPFTDKIDETPASTLPLTIQNAVTEQEFSIDLARIRQRRNDLFPFVTWDLRFLDTRAATSRASGITFPSQFLPGTAAADKALALTPGALQALVDRAWSRRERWTNLAELVGLAKRYDPDRGDLSRAFFAYVTQNVPQPYEDHGFADPLFWIVLTLAADDAPLLEFANGYLAQHPVSRVSTDLLFLLDQSAESSCDVLGRVLRVGTTELTLDATRRGNPEAFALATSLATNYRAWLAQFHVNPAERCTAARVAMLRRIIDTSPGGYGVADARVRLGTLLWTAERRDEAAAWWRGIAPDERGVYQRVGRELRGAVEDGAVEHNPGRIRAILHDEERRWRETAGERLDDFGWTADRF